MGAFGIKIPHEYGGLGLSQTSYTHAIGLVTSHGRQPDGPALRAQSIGVPQPLKLFGTAEQKQQVLPAPRQGRDLARSRSTEVDVGSRSGEDEHDRRRPPTTATHFILNGEKLWCTNGTAPSCSW